MAGKRKQTEENGPEQTKKPRTSSPVIQKAALYVTESGSSGVPFVGHDILLFRNSKIAMTAAETRLIRWLRYTFGEPHDLKFLEDTKTWKDYMDDLNLEKHMKIINNQPFTITLVNHEKQGKKTLLNLEDVLKEARTRYAKFIKSKNTKKPMTLPFSLGLPV